jgi:hypothetical protein
MWCRSTKQRRAACRRTNDELIREYDRSVRETGPILHGPMKHWEKEAFERVENEPTRCPNQ